MSTPTERKTPMISRQQIQDMFDSMRAKAKWSIDEVCCWGYYFTDYDRAKLMNAMEVLKDKGYRVVGIMEPSPDDDDQKLLMLHVEKEERHTVESLLARNDELYGVARTLGLRSYDGMDVGPVNSGRK
jgi:hypothetical protein